MAGTLCFGQAGALRDYIGLIKINYHSDVIAYMGKFKERFEKRGYTNAAKAIDNYLKGLSGSGFVYVAADGTCYVLTNEHVVTQSEALSITFEKQDGSKTVYERLKVLFVDEEKDLAILVFDAGVKPFTQSLTFSTTAVDEGTDVFAAGFPGLGNTAIWQFSRGTVSNAAARIPKDNINDETIGPYIQHTAQVDPGSSGGPLLTAATGARTGYTVAGINTLSVRRRQATNYAIPINQVRAFIDTALSKEPANDRELIARKIDDFIKGLKANKAVYDHIAKFISNTCTASNAEFAISELLDKAPRSVLEDIGNTFASDPVQGMNAAVAWNIENSMRTKSGTLKINLDSLERNDKGDFNVIFNVNDTLVKSEWVKEYGVFRMDTFGTITGDKDLLAEKQKKKDMDKNLKTDYDFAVSASYAYVLNHGSAIHVATRILNPFTVGADLFYGLGADEYFHIGTNVGYAHPIRLNSFALTPFGEAGVSYVTSKSTGSLMDLSDNIGFGFAIPVTLKAGLMFTSAAVPGLFGHLFYEHNIILFEDKNKSIKNHGIIGVGIGYGFNFGF
ncbi:MAG: serine protease [Treponema sp.]|nr:serine protease [Treponema sp.]